MNSPTASDQPTRPNRFRFRLRDLFVAILFAALLCGWWVDRQRILRQAELQRMRLEQLLQSQGQEDVATSCPQNQSPALTPTEFVQMVANGDDWYELQQVLVPFRVSDTRDQAVDGLLNLLSDPDEVVRTRSLSALAQIKAKGEVVVPATIAILDDPVSNVQWHAASLLGEFGGESRQGIPKLTEKMMDDECGIAAFAAIVVNKIDPAIDIGPRLTDLVKSPMRENRWRAVKELPRHVSEETAKHQLAAAFEAEEDMEIREMIARELNRIALEERLK